MIKLKLLRLSEKSTLDHKHKLLVSCSPPKHRILFLVVRIRLHSYLRIRLLLVPVLHFLPFISHISLAKNLSVLLFIATKDHNILLLNFAMPCGITALFSPFLHLVLLTTMPLPSHFSPRSKKKISAATIIRPKMNSAQQ